MGGRAVRLIQAVVSPGQTDPDRSQESWGKPLGGRPSSKRPSLCHWYQHGQGAGQRHSPGPAQGLPWVSLSPFNVGATAPREGGCSLDSEELSHSSARRTKSGVLCALAATFLGLDFVTCEMGTWPHPSPYHRLHMQRMCPYYEQLQLCPAVGWEARGTPGEEGRAVPSPGQPFST